MTDKSSIETLYSKLDEILKKAIDKNGDIVDMNDVGNDGYNLACMWFLESEGYIVNNGNNDSKRNHQWRISPKGHILFENGGFTSGYQKELELERTREKLDRLQVEVSQSTLDTNSSIQNQAGETSSMNSFSKNATIGSIVVAVVALGISFIGLYKGTTIEIKPSQEELEMIEVQLEEIKETTNQFQNINVQFETLKQEVQKLTMKVDSASINN